MNTVNQNRLPATNLTDRRNEAHAEPDLTRMPLQALMEDANAGGDQHNGAGPSEVPAAAAETILTSIPG